MGRVLNYGEQKNIEGKLQELKDSRNEKEVIQGVNLKIANKNAAALVDRRIKNLEGILSSQGVGAALSGKEKEDAEKECRLLEEKLHKDMPTWGQFVGSRPKDGPNHDKIVNWIIESEADPERRQLKQRWKNLRRQLYPNNPKAAHDMYLYPS